MKQATAGQARALGYSVTEPINVFRSEVYSRCPDCEMTGYGWTVDALKAHRQVHRQATIRATFGGGGR